jgi:hypothetical protein
MTLWGVPGIAKTQALLRQNYITTRIQVYIPFRDLGRRGQDSRTTLLRQRKSFYKHVCPSTLRNAVIYIAVITVSDRIPRMSKRFHSHITAESDAVGARLSTACVSGVEDSRCSATIPFPDCSKHSTGQVRDDLVRVIPPGIHYKRAEHCFAWYVGWIPRQRKCIHDCDLESEMALKRELLPLPS